MGHGMMALQAYSENLDSQGQLTTSEYPTLRTDTELRLPCVIVSLETS